MRSWKPSMEPTKRSGTRGFNGATTLRSWKPQRPRPDRRADSASMEPRPCGRGNEQWSSRHGTEDVGFNGATTLRSWKPPTGRRGRPSPRSFNGATTLRSWKLDGAQEQRLSDPIASMEPRPCGRGNLYRHEIELAIEAPLQWSHDLAVVETRSRRPCSRRRASFNGATTLRSWKPHGGRQRPLVPRCFNGATTLRSWKPSAL